MSLNPNAPSWTPNPTASAFVPRSVQPQPQVQQQAPPGFGQAYGQVPPGFQQAAPASQPLVPKPTTSAKSVTITLGGKPEPKPEPKAEPPKAEPKEEEEEEDASLNIQTGEVPDQQFIAKTSSLSLHEKEEPKIEESKVEEAKVEAPKPEPKVEVKVEEKAPAPSADDDDEGEEEFEEGTDEATARRHVNLVFIGHVDAGKSTLCGHIMYLTGGVDDRTLEKFEREAKSLGRESWKFAWAMDITANERAKGKTEECGVAWFSTESKRFTILDAPGHKSFIPHMIGGASQADVAVLVISARKGEFETGFEKGGQTREHAMLAKTVGVRQIIVAVTKMDDPTVEWDQARFDEIKEKLTPYMKTVGYGPTELEWIPISGLHGANIKNRVEPSVCPWYTGPSLLEYLNNMQAPPRLFDKPLRLPISGKYKERGVMVTGKLEAGTIKTGEKLIVMPNKSIVVVEKIYLDTTVIKAGEPGDNLRLKLAGVGEDDLQIGHVLCRADNLCRIVKKFRAQIKILEHKSILTAGYSCVMHIHSVIQQVTIDKLEAIMKGSKVEKANPHFARPGQSITAQVVLESSACMETYKDFQQLGRFMLRDEGVTVGIGIIQEILEAEN